MKGMVALASKRRGDIRTMSPRLVPVQIFSVQGTYFFKNVYRDVTLFEKCLNIARSQSPDKWRGGLDSIDVRMLLVFDMTDQGITVKKSTIPHPYACPGLFASQAIGKNEVLASYYGPLNYADLAKGRHKTTTYVESSMQVTAETFGK